MHKKFICGIKTTSICEGIKSFIKRYVEKKNSLVDFNTTRKLTFNDGSNVH